VRIAYRGAPNKARALMTNGLGLLIEVSSGVFSGWTWSDVHPLTADQYLFSR